jgi:hypothetical protein
MYNWSPSRPYMLAKPENPKNNAHKQARICSREFAERRSERNGSCRNCYAVTDIVTTLWPALCLEAAVTSATLRGSEHRQFILSLPLVYMEKDLGIEPDSCIFCQAIQLEIS